MRKLFLFSALAAFAILGCNGSGDMPCVDCAEPFPYLPSSPSGQSSSSRQQPFDQSSSSEKQIWDDEKGYCFYAEYMGCIYEKLSDCRGYYYGSDKTCGDNGSEPPIQISSSSQSDDSPLGSSSSGVIYGTPVIIGEETYETVVIGTQTWTARNLNLYNNNDNPNGCGLLYDWATAMALDNSCNNTAGCLPTPMGPPKYRGICPEGWHIPSDADWNILMEAVGGASTAGRYLKAVSDLWNGRGKGEDKYGFAALPCGYMNLEANYFDGFGAFGGWWSSTEVGNKYDDAYYWRMESKSENAYQDNHGYGGKSYLRNVRCVKN
jgi:uncharacterized protein (TIGR02145 family)